LACSLAGAQLPYEESFSLDEVLALPVTDPPVASPAGNVVAWVVEERGRRNVWVAAPPAEPRPLTQFDEDNGMLIGNLSFSPDGQWLVFGRGGRVNNRGEVYNPRNLPDPVENTLWRVSVDGGEAKPIETGQLGSVFSANGDLLFTRGTEIWSRPFPEGEAERLLTIRGSASNLRPSPDGTKLAFVSNRGRYGRGNYSFVGVYDFETRSVTYIAPNIEQDRDPTWSPDGSRIAFIRVPLEPKSYRFTDFRDTAPWSIVVGDPKTGEGEVLWSADPGSGSYFQGRGGSPLLWSGNHLVFPWEKSGWNLLYALPVLGGKPRLLTPGEHEVVSMALAPDGKTVAYTSNRDDLERWHLWRVNVESGDETQLTSGSGVERAPVFLQNGYLAYLEERANRASRVKLLTPAGEAHSLGALDQSDSVFNRFQEPEIVSFAAPDGLRIYAHLYRPSGTLVPKAHPVFVYAHGGCHSKSDPIFRSHIREGLLQYLASRGYFVLTVNFRSGTGRGLSFREPPRYGGRGAEEIQDFVGVASYLGTLPEVDPNAVAIGGWSCGGHIVTNVLARHSDLYAAGVSYAGVGDWRVEMEMDSGRRLPFRISRRLALEDLAFESSAVAHLDTWTSPILFVHGDNDLQAAMWPTIEMALLLRRKGVPVDTLVFPGEDHGFYLHANRERLAHRVWSFLSHHVGPKR
jgi:dipeptidyl aminopeptidase/acylaminoacyl peptidase